MKIVHCIRKAVIAILLVWPFASSIDAKNNSHHLVDSILVNMASLPTDTAKVDSLERIAYLMHLHDPIAGIELSRIAYLLADSLEFQRGMAKSENTWGLNYYSLTEYPKALEHILRALDIYKKINSPAGEAACYTNLGITFRENGDLEKAEKYFYRALANYKDLSNHGRVAATWWNLANVAWNRDSLQLALELFERSLTLGREYNGNTGMTMATLSSMAEIYSRPGMDHLAGVKLALEALGLRSEVQERFAEIDAHYRLSILYFVIATDDDPQNLKILFGGEKTAALQAAKIQIDSAIAGAEMGDLNLVKYDYFNLLSKVQHALGMLDEALISFQEYSLLKDSALTLEKDKKLTQKSMQYEFDLREAETIAEQEKKAARNRVVRNGITVGLIFSLVFLVVVWGQRNKINAARKRSDELLFNILPEVVAKELKEKGQSEAQLIDQVTVLFTDFKGFTALAEKLSAKELVDDINLCFSEFDQITAKFGIEKIKTIGDAYMAAGGLPIPNTTNAKDVVKAALEMNNFITKGKAQKLATDKPYFEIRIGVHTGPVVAGIVGVKKFQYDIWGDTVNTASRMESSGEVGKVNISQNTYDLLKDDAGFTFESRGKIEAKGKGEIEMYFVSKA